MLNHWILSVLLAAFISSQLRCSDAGSFGNFLGNPDNAGEDLLRQNTGNAHDNRHIYTGISKDRVRQFLFPDTYQRNSWKQSAGGARPLSPYSVASSDSMDDTEGDGWAPFENYGNLDDQLPSTAFWDDSNNLITKREGHSLSIVNPLDVLRQRLMLEMARRRMKENQDQIKANEAILKSLGKRNNNNLNNQTKIDRSDEFGNRRGQTNRRRAQRQDYDNTQDSGATDFDV